MTTPFTTNLTKLITLIHFPTGRDCVPAGHHDLHCHRPDPRVGQSIGNSRQLASSPGVHIDPWNLPDDHASLLSGVSQVHPTEQGTGIGSPKRYAIKILLPLFIR